MSTIELTSAQDPTALDELLPSIPAGMRTEAVSVAAEVKAVTENMRAVLTRAVQLHAEASKVDERMNEAFQASTNGLAVRAADAAWLFFSTMSGSDELGSALLELRDLVDID